MATEEVKYTIPSDGQNDARQVDVIFTYNPLSPNADGSYTVTNATGTYITKDNNGNTLHTDTITGLLSAQTFGQNDNELFLAANPTTTPIVDKDGISFTINNNSDSNSGTGNVNFFDNNGVRVQSSPPTNTPQYREDGTNTSAATNVSEAPACYLAGTMIRGVDGDIAVEELVVGDKVVTSSGTSRPVRWLGHQAIDCRAHPRPHEVMPIRITRHAFGQNRPARDLHVSPGHAICVDLVGEVLMPAGALVNGTTIRQIDVESVVYWHVELDGHDVILADNLPAESYLDMGNRGFFREADVVVLGAGPDAPVAAPASFERATVNPAGQACLRATAA